MKNEYKKLRKYLSADPLFSIIKTGFEAIEAKNISNGYIPLSDVLMSGFAMFSLKDQSLLNFDKRRKETNINLLNIYHIGQIPSDTQMRKRLDVINPKELCSSYTNIFRQAQRGKILEQFVYMGGCYLLSLDGTGYFSSKNIFCEHCLQKVNSKTGEITYQHQMLGAAIVHPNMKTVIPLAPEPILKQDGQEKNDCERNAAKRFLKQLRKDHPHLKFIVVEDGLSSNAPHIKELIKHGLRFILGVKRGDHNFLFNYVDKASEAGQVTEFEIKQADTIHRFRFINNVPLNASNQDVLVNFLEYWEITPEKTQHFSWVTDFKIYKNNSLKIMRGGRSRWKIENENFNTLKNQGYNFEHNYGHGNNNLSVVFAYLMMLAFLVDQIQQIACSLFQDALEKMEQKTHLWEVMRALFRTIVFSSMADIYKAIIYGYTIKHFEINCKSP